MRISWAFLALTLLVPGSVAAQPTTETDMSQMIYPETKQIPVVEDHFGHTITDPYRWLENDVRSDEEVSQWVEAQNSVTDEYLAGLPGRAVFAERMAALLNYEQVSAPVKRGGRYFYTRNSGQENQPTLYVRDDLGGPAKALINPNAWSADSGDALAEWSPSDDGRLVAYGVQQGGTDWRTIRVLDVDTGTVLEDSVAWARFTDIAWAPDASGFFYARFPEPEGANAAAGIVNHAVYFHAIGTPQSEDRLIYADPTRPTNLVPIKRTADGRYLAIYPTPGAGANALAVVDLDSEYWTPRMLIEDFTADWSVVGNGGSRLYVNTNQDAERGKIVVFDLAEAEPQPVEVVAEDEAVISNAILVGGRLLTTYLVDAQTEMRRFLPDGTPDGVVDLPGIGTAGGIQGDFAEDEAFFLFTSFDTPITVYRYDVAANSYDGWAEPKLAANFNNVVVEQRFYTSKDGTQVPMFIVSNGDVTKPAPTLLYGYGGFGIPMVPFYNPLQMAWVEQGGVLAVANIRGGGEYGRAWHRAGQLENRQNAYDDFIAASEYLKAEKIASDDGLVVQGESNGGLLVGVVTNQRPDLFAAALPGVGVMDMLRYHQFTGGALWISDFGSPDEEVHFDNLLAYSPYHNIRDGEDYPAILATTADTDDRVVPGHTFKYTAALQAADLGDKPHLVRIETRAGHGAGMPLDKVIALHADQWAFAAHWAGLEVGKTP
ncbi:S9 family peptidase [Devosia sp. SL43]|nr:S9 family peptidase [Devosia sp. SL43]